MTGAFLVFLVCFFNHAAAQQAKQITFTGKIVDRVGRPATGAKITAYEMHFDGMAGGILLRQVGEVTAAKDGAFAFSAQPKTKRSSFHKCYLVAGKQGMALGWAVWNMRENVELNIVLGEPKRLEGVIVDEAGKPIADAEVRANLLRTLEKRDGKEESAWLPGIAPINSLGTRTDRKGRFRFDNIPAGSGVDLLVRAKGKASIYTYRSGVGSDSKAGQTAIVVLPDEARIEDRIISEVGSAFKAGQTDVKVVLPDEARIEGRIIDINTGRGLSGVQLAVVSHFSLAFYDRFICTSAEGGMFAIGGLRSGEYLIRGHFPSVDVDVVSGRCTNDVLIGVRRRVTIQAPKKTTTEQQSDVEIMIGMRVIKIPADAMIDEFELNESLTNGLLVRYGNEIANRLLALTDERNDAKQILTPQVLMNNNSNGVIAIKNTMVYTGGYKSVKGEPGKLTAQYKTLDVGLEYKIHAEILESGEKVHIELAAKQQKPTFETLQYRPGYDYQIPSPAEIFVTEMTAKNGEPVVIGRLRRGETVFCLIVTPSVILPERQPEPLLGKKLPEPENIQNIDGLKQAEGKRALVYFWDMEQRPSRNSIMQLAKQAENLKEQNIIVVTVHASAVNEDTLHKWIKYNNIPFPVGMIQNDVEKTRFTWGVKSLPWLILTDHKHIVQAEGFGINELDEKITTLREK